MNRIRLRRSPRFAVALALAFAVLASAGGQVLFDEYRLVPSAAVLELASGPEDPGAGALLEAAVLFSGADAARVALAMDAGQQLMKEAASLGRAVRDEASVGDASAREYELGSRLLALVHSRLKRYDEYESRIDRALLEGRYNCVSSATLYTILASAAGIAVSGVILPDHVYCTVTIEDRRVDVETTSAAGYDNTSGRPVSGLAWSVGGTAGGTVTSARGVVALVLRNRSTLAERGRQWAAALALAVDAYAYVSAAGPDGSTWETLAGRIQNCVSALMESKRWADAVALADRAIAVYGEAEAFIELRKFARLAFLTDALRDATGREALALADGAAAAGEVDAAWLERAYAWAYASLADERRAQGDHLGAWKAAAEGAARFPASGEMARLEASARSNWVKDAHNRFAALYNARRYAEALELIKSALAVAPGERMLLDDEEVAAEALAPR